MRNSKFELVRIISVFGIIVMHTLGKYQNDVEGINLIFTLLLNQIFNMGVSLFALISGYFGVRLTAKKFITLECLVIYYSLLNVAVSVYLTGAFSVKELLLAFIPVSARNYWYIQGYMLVLLFSPFINKYLNQITKYEYKKLLLLLIIVFCICPTLTNHYVMNDYGKGPMTILFMYICGRYIGMYLKSEEYNNKKLLLYLIILQTIGFVGNCVITVSGMKGDGIAMPFAADFSVFIVFSSFIVFLLVKKGEFKSKIINYISSCGLGIYLSERVINMIIGNYISLDDFINKREFILLILVQSLFVMLVGIIVEIIRKGAVKVFFSSIKYDRIDDYIRRLLETHLNKGKE